MLHIQYETVKLKKGSPEKTHTIQHEVMIHRFYFLTLKQSVEVVRAEKERKTAK